MISSPSTFPLQGIRVVDLSRLLPGPYLTQLLADLGAEVVKVETPLAGDYARMAPPETGLAGLYAAVNGGKKSLAVNHRRPEGREILYRLVAEADVFVEGFRPGAVKRWGLDYETRLFTPELVDASTLAKVLAQAKAARVGSGDYQEEAFAGVDHALSAPWREESLRFVILVGDASSHPRGH
jgi:crotonobetainyl-CoA:carnitine CoA-transferase CaiB-like acyl-CoA transferase